ncbi:hypothetical protein GEMRC1_008165 [Eukaryota sp. GEM-RC1]
MTSGNVSDDIDDATLRELFSPYGRVVSTKTGLCGFAFVDFEDDKDVDKAVEALNGTEFNDKRITVERARGPRRRGRPMRDSYSRRPSSSFRSSRGRRSSIDEDDREDRFPRHKRSSRSPSPKRSSSYVHPYMFPPTHGQYPMMMPYMMPGGGSFGPERDRSGAPSNMMGMFNPYMMPGMGVPPPPGGEKGMEQYMMYQQNLHHQSQHQGDEDLPPPISEHSGWQRSSSPRSPPRGNW